MSDGEHERWDLVRNMVEQMEGVWRSSELGVHDKEPAFGWMFRS